MDIRAIHLQPPTVETPAHRQRRTAAAPADAQAVQDQQPASTQNQPVLTADEQRFFEGLFPESAGDVRGHQAYTGEGNRSATHPGTIVDRRV